MEQKSTEIWKDALGYEGVYQVSNLGRVMRLPGTRIKGHVKGKPLYAKVKQAIIRGTTRPNGYVVISLSMNGKYSREYLHRLIAGSFVENPKGERTVNHIDGNPSNNTASNLEWCSYSENHLHAYKELGRKHNKSMLGKLGLLNKKSIAIKQIKDGKTINQFGSMREAERETGISNGRISLACKGKVRAAGGYEWNYLTK